jgi:hypothetical protein
VARNVIDLGAVPPGLYVDESSIAYNAWAVAHYGVDEHGFHLPLYFEAFGEYKNPLYVYALVPFARFLTLTPAVERLPAALFGLVAVLFLTLAAWRITRSRPITAFVLLLATLTPWLVQESRVGFEVISMLATLSVALWCLADERRITPMRFAVAGLFFALSIFAYSTGRLEVLLFAVAFALAYRTARLRGWWLALVVIAAGYVVLAAWALSHPGALTAEFSIVSIGADGAPLPTLIGRFAANYISYFSPDYLFVHGDPNLRHNTGYAGMLLAITGPLLLLGLYGCWRRRHEALPRFVLLCLVLGPIAAALTNNFGAPHALRSADMLPFLIVLAVFGLDAARVVLRRFAVVAVAVVLATVAQGALYTLDMYTAYPARAAVAFDTGVPQAIGVAARAAAGHTVYLSSSFEAPYIQAFYALLPPPPQTPVGDDAGPGLRRLHMVVLDPGSAERVAATGDIIVASAFDPPLSVGVSVVAVELAPRDPLVRNAPAVPLVYVYRVG